MNGSSSRIVRASDNRSCAHIIARTHGALARCFVRRQHLCARHVFAASRAEKKNVNYREVSALIISQNVKTFERQRLS